MATQVTSGAPVVSLDLTCKDGIDSFIAAMKASVDEVGSKAVRALATAQERALSLEKS